MDTNMFLIQIGKRLEIALFEPGNGAMPSCLGWKR
jgi:hypothetical protein